MNHLVRGLVFDESNNQNSPSTFYSVKDRTDTGGSDPVPELPTAILLAVGLVVLVGYVYIGGEEKEEEGIATREIGNPKH
jgi:hypothetical protein